MARVTLQTVANRVGVSRMTVSNAFSRPDQLSAELRARILATATELGYTGPDPAARALAKGATGAVGMVLTTLIGAALSDPVATRFLGAVVAGLTPAGLSLTLLATEETDGHVPARDVPMDGALVYDCDPDSAALAWLLRRRLPLVLVDQKPIENIPCINVDDAEGAQAAADHLLNLGHRRIGIVNADVVGPHGVQPATSGPGETFVSAERLRGWRLALSRSGITPIVVKQPSSSLPEGQRGLEVLLEVDPGITAVLCFSDTLAHGAMLAARQRGLNVPADLSVVGFDDSPLAASLQPALTTVHQDVGEKGRLAAGFLVKILNRNPGGQADPLTSPSHVVLPTELIVRESTNRPRTDSSTLPRS